RARSSVLCFFYFGLMVLLAALPLVDRPPADIGRPSAGFVPREKPLVPRVESLLSVEQVLFKTQRESSLERAANS
ncbi:MAG: hypothetical protein OIF58_06920, partial [Cohaesibacter sp.]|nr:hypothetical protein [Cohaesibacter sp.]